MKRLIVMGDPGIRRGAVLELDAEEKVCFQINRNGEWHGPEEPQLWCVVGDEDEREDFATRNYVPHWLDVETVDADELTILQERGA